MGTTGVDRIGGTLEHAIALAAMAHKGQRDKADAPYILHLLRVMMSMSTDDERLVAVLHDVMEDAGFTRERLRRAGFSESVVTAVDALTKRCDEEQDYDAFIRRAAQNEIARAVKLADLRDNLDMTRIAHPTDDDRRRCVKYERAMAWIRSHYPEQTD